MKTLKIIFTTLAILAGVALLIASWYIILILAFIMLAYLLAYSYYTLKDI